MNEQKKPMYATEQEWRPVMPMGWQQQEPAGGWNIMHVRTGNDATMHGHAPQIQREMLVTEKRANQTGNQEPRNHPIRVPTAPGEPVREEQHKFKFLSWEFAYSEVPKFKFGSSQIRKLGSS